MAVKAASEVTITDNTDIDSLATWYYLTTSATKPAAPTTTKTSETPPSPWTQAEPTFAAGTVTNYLYTCVQTRWKDDSCAWGAVQLSSAYEQAKQAWNKAQAAYDATQPIASKTYTGLIGTANDAANASFYFAKVHPDDYNGTWLVKLRVTVTAPTTYQQSIDISISGRANAFMAYDSFVGRSTAALAVYFINLYRAKQAGITAGKGHALGFGLRASTNPTNATYARTITVDVIEQANCTVQLMDTAVKYADMDGTGTTNYEGLTELTVVNNGQNATNNANTYDRTLYNSNVKAAANLTAGRIVCGTSAGYKNIEAGTAFDIGYPLLYNNTAYNAGAMRADLDLVRVNIAFSNNGTIESATAHELVFLKGTVVGNSFTIAESPFLTCNVPTSADGFCYLPLGRLRDSTTNGQFTSTSELWCFKDGAFGPVSLREAEAAKKTATNYITRQGSGDTWVHAENLGPDSSGNPTATTRGWRIGDALDLFRGTVSHFRVWLDAALGKVRVRIGAETSGHVVLDDSGMEVFESSGGGSSSAAKFGNAARIGNEQYEHAVMESGAFSIVNSNGSSLFRCGHFDASRNLNHVMSGTQFSESVDYPNARTELTGYLNWPAAVPNINTVSDYTLNVVERTWDDSTGMYTGYGTDVSKSRIVYPEDFADYGIIDDWPAERKATVFAIAESGALGTTTDVTLTDYGEPTYQGLASTPLCAVWDDSFDGYVPVGLNRDATGNPYVITNFIGNVEYWYGDDKRVLEFGTGVTAASENQAVIGRHNVVDDSDEYAFIIGNGADEDHPSNAAAVKWNGDLECGDVNGVTLSDGGWITATLNSSFVVYSTNRTPKYRKLNGMVEIRGAVKPTTAQTLGETALTIFTLPEGYRPGGNCEVTALCQASARRIWLLSVHADGKVTAQRLRDMGSTSYQSVATTEWMIFDAVFTAG